MAPEHANGPVRVFDCLVCGLALYGEDQLRAAGVAAPDEGCLPTLGEEWGERVMRWAEPPL